jgi:hypothetical protein
MSTMDQYSGKSILHVVVVFAQNALFNIEQFGDKLVNLVEVLSWRVVALFKEVLGGVLNCLHAHV